MHHAGDVKIKDIDVAFHAKAEFKRNTWQILAPHLTGFNVDF